MQEVEGLYYPCSENKGADQLRVYREADPHRCFRICKKLVFSRRGSFLYANYKTLKQAKSIIEQACLSLTWLETLKTGILATGFK